MDDVAALASVLPSLRKLIYSTHTVYYRSANSIDTVFCAFFRNGSWIRNLLCDTLTQTNYEKNATHLNDYHDYHNAFDCAFVKREIFRCSTHFPIDMQY